MNILVAPLNWGLGHATRCVPIIEYLSKLKHNVLIASSGAAFDFLQLRFPKHELIRLPDYEIMYSSNMPLKWRILFSSPKIFSKIKQEHQLLDKLIEEKKIERVISDNRFGLYTKKIPCAFITHQLNINVGLFSTIANKINNKYINRYTQCWVPDDVNSYSKAGKLATNSKNHKHLKYIGILSRFMDYNIGVTKKQNQIAVILSGPEPQRTILEKIVFTQIKKYKQDINKKIIIVRGKPGDNSPSINNSAIAVYNHLNDAEMLKLICTSELIVSRSGYSTIMDLNFTSGNAAFVPTPGQPEQEYLAKLYQTNKIAFFVPQNNFDLLQAITESKKYSGFKAMGKNDLYTAVLNDFINTPKTNLLSEQQ